ncbi:hypothetical protein BSKO_11136 [Bryopsis sp. KO-2023]|nr:hypothetical protein BSKO_11136 [Bryopsis sp. KO-2023]
MEAENRFRSVDLNGGDWEKVDLEECLEQLKNAYTTDCISNPDVSAFSTGWECALAEQSRTNSACYRTITPQSPCTDNRSAICGSIFRGDVGEDGAIDVFLDEYKRHHKMSNAVTTIAAIWRGRKPRETFRKYLDLRKRANKRDQTRVLYPWIQYIRASKHRVTKLKRRALMEWWDLARTTTTYFNTLANLLERSFDGVTMPASQIYRLCASRKVGTSFQSCIPSVARLLVNVLSSQYPWRRQRAVFSAWKERSVTKMRSRQSGVAVLTAMRKADWKGRVKSAFRYDVSARLAILKVAAFSAFKENALEFRAVAKRLRDFLMRWISFARESVRERKLQKAVNIMDTTFRKSRCFQSLRKYSVAQRMLKAAGTIQIWHRMSLATVHIHAWRGDIGRMWFVLCWRAWKSYAMRRLQWSIMMGNHLLTRSNTAQGLVFSAWRKVVERVKEAPDRTESSGGFASDDSKVVAYLEEHHAITPWRPPITRKDVMRPVARADQVPHQDIREAIKDMMSVRYCGGDGWILPRFWRHTPSEQALRLRSRRKGMIRLWLESDAPDVWIWQKIVALKVSRSIGYEDPSHLVDAESRKPLDYQKVRERSAVRRRRGGIVIVDDDADMFEEVSRFHACLVHAEGFLETKAHGILGVGAESTNTLYQIWEELSKSKAKAGDLLTWFIQPIVDHDLKYNAAVWNLSSLRDKKLSQVVDIHDLALAMQRHREEFTLQQSFDPRANWHQIWERWDANSDDSDTDEQEGFGNLGESQASLHQIMHQQQGSYRLEGRNHLVEKTGSNNPKSKLPSGNELNGSGDKSLLGTPNEEVSHITHVRSASPGELVNWSVHSDAESTYTTGRKGIKLGSRLSDQAGTAAILGNSPPGILNKIDARHVNRRLSRSSSYPSKFEKTSDSVKLRTSLQPWDRETQDPIDSAETTQILADASGTTCLPTPAVHNQKLPDTPSAGNITTRGRSQSHDHDHRELDRSALNKNIAISPQRRRTSSKVEDAVYETILPVRESPLRKSTDPEKEEIPDTHESDSQKSAELERSSCSGERRPQPRKDPYRPSPRKHRRTLTVADAGRALSTPHLVCFGEKVAPNNQNEHPWEIVEAKAHPAASVQGARLEVHEGKENSLSMSPMPSSNREEPKQRKYSPDLFQNNFNIDRGTSFTEIVSRLQDTDLKKSQDDAEVLAEELARAIEAKRQTSHRRALSPERKANLHQQRLMGQLVGSLPRLDDLDDVVAQGIDPDNISGLRLCNCPKHFVPILGRIAVQPLATKFLFWQKVQELKNLRQRIAEDQMLAEQIKEAVWKSGAEFLLSSRTRDPKHEERVVYGGLCVGRAPWMPNTFEKVTGIVDTPFPANFVEIRRTEEFVPGATFDEGENNGTSASEQYSEESLDAGVDDGSLFAGSRQQNHTDEKQGTFHDVGWETFERCATQVDRNAACTVSARKEYAHVHTSDVRADGSPKQLGWVTDTCADLDRRREHTRTDDPMYHPPSPPKTPSPRKCSHAPKTVRRIAEKIRFQAQYPSEPSKKSAKPSLLGYPLANITPPNAPSHLDSRQSLHTVRGTPAGLTTRLDRSADSPRKTPKTDSRAKPKRTVVYVGFKKSEVPSSPFLDSWSHDERDAMDPLKSYIASQAGRNGDMDIADRISVQSWEAESCPSTRQFN